MYVITIKFKATRHLPCFDDKPSVLWLSTKSYLRVTPLHREHSAYNRKRLVFRLSSTLKRLLTQVGNGIYCLRAIMEFTAAGQSEIHTHIPN